MTFLKKEDTMMATEPRTDRPVAKLFNGKYTVESTETGEHRTFWIKTQPVDAEFAPGRRVVSLLTGSQNDDPACYTSFGFVDDAGIHVWPSKRLRSRLWDEYADLLWTLALDGAFSPWVEKGYKIHIEGHCLRCGRVLTDPISIKTGVGPYCGGRA
jgi:hypothetical protein